MRRDCCYGVCLEWIVWCLSICYLKRSRSVRLVSPIYYFLHLWHWIIYVRFAESQVMWCLICLVSPVLVKVYDNVWAGEQSGLAGLCPQGVWVRCRCLRVSHKRVGHGGLVNGTRRARSFLCAVSGFGRQNQAPRRTREKTSDLWYPREGEWQKATTGTSLKMFLKRSVDCRMGFLAEYVMDVR